MGLLCNSTCPRETRQNNSRSFTEPALTEGLLCAWHFRWDYELKKTSALDKETGKWLVCSGAIQFSYTRKMGTMPWRPPWALHLSGRIRRDLLANFFSLTLLQKNPCCALQGDMVKAGTISASHTGLVSATCRAPGGEARTLLLVFRESLILYRVLSNPRGTQHRVVSHLGTLLTCPLQVLSYWGQSHTKQLQCW